MENALNQPVDFHTGMPPKVTQMFKDAPLLAPKDLSGILLASEKTLFRGANNNQLFNLTWSGGLSIRLPIPPHPQRGGHYINFSCRVKGFFDELSMILFSDTTNAFNSGWLVIVFLTDLYIVGN